MYLFISVRIFSINIAGIFYFIKLFLSNARINLFLEFNKISFLKYVLNNRD